MKKILELLSNFFASLFGKRTSPTTTPTSPQPNDRGPAFVEDSSDVPRDTIITVSAKTFEPLPTPADGPFADDDKEDAFDEPETPMPDTPEPAPADPDPAPATPTSPTGGNQPTTPTGGGTPAPTQPSQPETPKPRYLWCLDNGHGKLQAGKRSPLFDDRKTRFFEYEFNRDVVERMIKALDKAGVKYYDIVPDYNEVGSFLEERVERANKKKSELPKIYVSVHANAGPAGSEEWVSSSVKGIETWYAQNSKKGQKIASIFQKHLVAKTGMKNRNLKSTAEKPLYVLEKTIMPAVLTENGFYNNKTEVAELMKSEVRQKIADAHVAAILEIEKNGL